VAGLENASSAVVGLGAECSAVGFLPWLRFETGASSDAESRRLGDLSNVLEKGRP
jgi:hypothetical protein